MVKTEPLHDDVQHVNRFDQQVEQSQTRKEASVVHSEVLIETNGDVSDQLPTVEWRFSQRFSTEIQLIQMFLQGHAESCRSAAPEEAWQEKSTRL